MKLKLIILVAFFIFPQVVLAVETCPPGENRYREGGSCEKESPFIHDSITQYPVTCQDPSSASYHREALTPPANPNRATVTIEIDVSQSALGGFGPNQEALNSRTPDALAALYPFNALFDKPPNTSSFNQRESFRTYWRLLSTLQQANAKASYLTEANQDKINNQTYSFYNAKEKKKDWTLKDLYDKLPNCLRKYPVCEDFTKKYQALNNDTKEAYDALAPFNFDNLRGYEVIKYNPPTGGTVTHIMAENLPYIAAINQGLLDTKTGLLNTLSPSWVIPNRQSKLTSDSTIKQSQENNLSSSIRNYVKVASCQNPTQNGFFLPAPLTFPKGIDGSSGVLEQTFQIDITTRVETRYSASGEPYNVYISEGTGKPPSSVQILNNPKQQDISLALAEDTSSSLFHMFTSASSQQTYQEKDLHVPLESDAVLARKGGQAHTKLCELRNKWFIPASLQRNLNCDSLDPSLTELNPTITPTTCYAKQHLYENTCGQTCYQEILDQTLATSSCNDQVLNPFYAIAITLNENGGLVSNNPEATSPTHFGCDPVGAIGVPETIDEKLSCMINTLRNNCQFGMTQEQNLKSYGYEPGNNIENLISLLEGPSNPQLFISPAQAAQNSSNLSTLLPTQKDFWYYYYAGYINNYCTTHP
jgi:hypothetical protein